MRKYITIVLLVFFISLALRINSNASHVDAYEQSVSKITTAHKAPESPVASVTASPIQTVVLTSVGLKKVASAPSSSVYNAPYNVSEIKAYISYKFGKYAPMALCISGHEDGTYNPYRIGAQNANGTYDYGIFQINAVHGYPLSTLFNWRANIDIAYNMSGGGTVWTAWSTLSKCQNI